MCSHIVLWKKWSFQLKSDSFFGKIGNLLDEGRMHISFSVKGPLLYIVGEDILLTKEAGDLKTIITVNSDARGWSENKSLINYL